MMTTKWLLSLALAIGLLAVPAVLAAVTPEMETTISFTGAIHPEDASKYEVCWDDSGADLYALYVYHPDFVNMAGFHCSEQMVGNDENGVYNCANGQCCSYTHVYPWSPRVWFILVARDMCNQVEEDFNGRPVEFMCSWDYPEQWCP